LIISKPLSSAKATIIYSKISIIPKKKVKYIDSKPPLHQTKLVTKSIILGFHPIDNLCF